MVLLSHRDVAALLDDIKPALEVILSERLGEEVTAEPLENVRSILEDSGIVMPEIPAEWWRGPHGYPFTVLIEDDEGRCDFWAIQRLCIEHGESPDLDLPFNRPTH